MGPTPSPPPVSGSHPSGREGGWFMHHRRIPAALGALLLLPATLALAKGPPPPPPLPCTSTGYSEEDIVSNVAGRADVRDSLLVNPWGLAFNPTGPIWVANNGTSTSEAISDTGTSLLRVTVPTTGEGPTGLVFYGGSDGFRVTEGGVSAPARFIFALQDG